jgi:hypothetical protein
MINYWWVTRPKRRLNSIPEVLAAIADTALNAEWQSQRGVHLSLEETLESVGIKREGERRDQTGVGARTYVAWVKSLGLIFEQESTGKLLLTLADEAIMAGDSPVSVLKGQILKYQFPSSFSLSRGVAVNERFKIRPFRFLLKLFADPDVGWLSQEEIAKVVMVESENETDACYKKVVDKLLLFRQYGDSALDSDFLEKYHSSKGGINEQHPYDNLLDIANTIENWLEYTQLAKRSDEDRNIRIIPDKADEVATILADNPPFIDRPGQHEFFQRKFGLDPKHRKDTRNLTQTMTITERMLAEQKIKKAFIGESLKSPVAKITTGLIDKIADSTGIDGKLVEETLLRLYPHGAIGAFMTEYFEMAFKGRDEATPFEKATAELFKNVFGYKSHHVGPIGLTPDVLILSDSEGYCGVIDNKAYSAYSISNDHHNLMVHNYIGGLRNYYDGVLPLAFFSYIAGGFSKNIDGQVADIVRETKVSGSTVSVSNIINLVERHSGRAYNHKKLREIFSLDRQVRLSDINSVPL